MKILFVAGFGPIASDITTNRAFFGEQLGIHLTADGDYLHTANLDGAKHFAVWPLSQAAQSCFGSDAWPEQMPTPTAWIEFDVDDLPSATRELQAHGHHILVADKEEPWGQRVTRLLSPDGLLVGLTITPSMRDTR